MSEDGNVSIRVTVPRGTIYTMSGVGWSPHEEIESLMPDILRLMKSVAFKCTDTSNVSLHFDELICELHTKLACILRSRSITFGSREKFFGFLKVSFQRHLKSTVQKYALTFKRTGVKPKTAAELLASRDEVVVDHPTSQVALDDEDSGAKNFVGEEDSGFCEIDLSDEIQFFVSHYLTNAERKVFFQEVSPNNKTMRLAFKSSTPCRKSRKFRVLDKHKAQGINISMCSYKRVLESIRKKLLEHWRFGSTKHYERYAHTNA